MTRSARDRLHDLIAANKDEPKVCLPHDLAEEVVRALDLVLAPSPCPSESERA